MIEPEAYLEKFSQLLEDTGGLYTMEDVFRHLEQGHMQSFAVNNTLAITQVCLYPRKKVLNLVGVVGHRMDLPALEQKLIEHARNYDCLKITTETNGRAGWDRIIFPGWKKAGIVYEKDVRHG